jgi:hypothetical protein
MQCHISHILVRPQLFEEFLFEDHPITMREEVDEHLKDLGPQRDRLPGSGELIALSIEEVVAKSIPHRHSLHPSSGIHN